MNRFSFIKDAPLRTRLTFINLLITGAALVVAAGVLVGIEFQFMRSAAIDDLRVQAQMVAANTADALLADDANAATIVLSALQASPYVTHALLQDNWSDTTALYRRSTDVDAFRPQPPHEGLDYHLHGSKVDMSVPILQDNRRLGVLHLRADLQPLYYRLLWYSVSAAAIVIVALFVAYLLLLGLRRALTKTEERLEFLAHFDTITNLPNRNMFNRALSQALARAHRSGRGVGLLFLDLDHFKLINDTLGHYVGDELLRGVAKRLGDALRKGDVVCRLGGDEFTVIVEGVSRPEAMTYVAQELVEAIAKPFRLQQSEVYVSTSIGISLYPADAADAATLLKHADTAMYHAKEKGRNNFQFFLPEMNSRSLNRLAIGTSLRHAIERNELSLRYQPQIDLSDGRIGGVEVLLRWHGSEVGVMSPADFIPVAEETGLIVPIGQWVLEHACAQARIWKSAGFQDLRVSVNLSSRQFKQENLVEMVVGMLRHFELPPGMLELEITESALVEDVEAVAQKLNRLRDLGIGIAIDDFGTGYSSMNYLKRFPITRLKIDSSFVRDIPHDKDDVAITAAIIAMGSSLGMRIVAEGVETKDQVEFLLANGCKEVQGYYFSKPVLAEEIGEMLKANAAMLQERAAATPSAKILPLLRAEQ